MNETNEIETETKPKMSKYQMLKMKVYRVAMRIIPVSMVLAVMGVGNAAALNNTSFQGVTDTIEAVIPIFAALQDLVVAVVPYIITLAVVGGLIVLIKNLFSKGLNWK